MTPKIIIIAALAKNSVIGLKNDVPWRIREDFIRFKKLTMGYPCIMGRVTYESLPENVRPLPGRENVIISSKSDYHPENTTVQTSFKEAIHYTKEQSPGKIFITGGSMIYREGLPIADVLELTQIHQEVTGDVYFPKIKRANWNLVAQEHHEGLDRIANKSIAYSFQTYHRNLIEQERVLSR